MNEMMIEEPMRIKKKIKCELYNDSMQGWKRYPIWFWWESDGKDTPKIHPAQKPIKLLKRLIEIFTDPFDVVIDPCFGSGSTGRAALEMNRHFYGFEINKEFYRRAKTEMCVLPADKQISLFEGGDDDD